MAEPENTLIPWLAFNAGIDRAIEQLEKKRSDLIEEGRILVAVEFQKLINTIKLCRHPDISNPTTAHGTIHFKTLAEGSGLTKENPMPSDDWHPRFPDPEK